LAKCAAILLLPLALAACASDTGVVSYTTSSESDANQPFPANYHDELLAFFKTYLNDPEGVHDAVIAEPTQRTVGGHRRYVSCVRFSARDTDGSYHPARERAIVYVDGRLDHIVEKPGDVCAGAVYAPFPDLEKLTR
jgi:hypothetical protein